MTIRFGFPPSVGTEDAQHRALTLSRYLTQSVGRQVQVDVATDYRSLKGQLISGQLAAAWGPPFICARVEAYGGRPLVRGVRRGTASYRSGLVALKSAKVKLVPPNLPRGLRLAWVDPDSVGGYLLPLARLRELRGMGPNLVGEEVFTGSYRAAVARVLGGTSDLAPVWAPTGELSGLPPGVVELAGSSADLLEVVAFSRDCPNDGVVASPFAPSDVVTSLELTFMGLTSTEEGRLVLKEVFGADRFERAPAGSYKALNNMVFGADPGPPLRPTGS